MIHANSAPAPNARSQSVTQRKIRNKIFIPLTSDRLEDAHPSGTPTWVERPAGYAPPP